MEKEFKHLKEENAELRDSIDNCLPINTAENKNIWKKINQLINNEIEQEKYCNQ